MIVSVNGREKKIAIVENGLVTEFYIERGQSGEAEQGIVGNIYKGRVQRVLPGMQSAFVDVGLERDAFLYVSDFFDEEEEFDRIVVEPKKDAPPAATSSSSREELPARSAGAALPPSAPPVSRDTSGDVAVERAPDAAAPVGASSASVDSERDADGGRRRRRGRGRGGDRGRESGGGGGGGGRDGESPRYTPRTDEITGAAEAPTADASTQTAMPATESPDVLATMIETDEEFAAREERIERQRIRAEDIATPFVVPVADFERIIDQEETATADGEMLKDAMMQERLTDQIRRVEFDMEPEPARTLGNSLDPIGSHASFERVTDADGGDAESMTANGRTTRAVVAASLGMFEDTDDAPPTSSKTSASFERISDDESATATSTTTTTAADAAASGAQQAAGDEQPRGNEDDRPRRTRSRRGGKKQADSVEASESPAEQTTQSAVVETVTPIGDETDAAAAPDAGDETATKKKRGTRAAGATKAKEKSAAATTKSAADNKTRARGKSRSSATTQTTTGDASASDGTNAESGELFADADASLKATASRGEFARRRRRSSSTGGANRQSDSTTADGESGDDETAATEEMDAAPTNGDAILLHEDAETVSDVDDEIVNEPEAVMDAANDDGEPIVATREPDAIAAASTANTERGGARRDTRDNRTPRDGGRESSNRNDTRDTRDTRDNRNGRDTRDSRGGGGGNAGGRGGRERPPTPMITDLLREGQEIIVQIAKEPIAAKGARITSHIALPGRFLVYMPTVEHVGVSRKIESDSERVRLRKLISAIRTEEDVPSGGFIVRTAGTGITDQDLRDDARYLVRTWRDIRKSAERTKAGSIVHRDLDLVQRILRDQLSDDFAAIRVDSEEEYLEIVEFVNRIQPRLVNRVKLHTREEPILEAYGVQAEIDKAIKPRVWLRSGGYLVINQTEALVAIDVNTGKFVGRGGSRLEDTITRTNMEAVDEIARQIRLRDLGGIIVLDLIDMEERRNRARVMQALQDALADDKSPTKVLSFNDFGLVIMTRKRVKQSLERTLCAPCPYCTGAGLVKSPQTVSYEILEEARRLARAMAGERHTSVTLRLHPEVARALRSTEKDVLKEIEDYLGAVDLTSVESIHQEQFDFALV